MSKNREILFAKNQQNYICQKSAKFYLPIISKILFPKNEHFIIQKDSEIEIFRNFQIFSEIFRNIKKVSETFRKVKKISETFRNFQILSDTFRNFQKN